MNGELLLESVPLIGELSQEASLEGTLSVDYAKMRYEEVDNIAGGLTAFIEKERDS